MILRPQVRRRLAAAAIALLPSVIHGAEPVAVAPYDESLCEGKGWVTKCPPAERIAIRAPPDQSIVRSRRIFVVADVAEADKTVFRVSVDGRSVPYNLRKGKGDRAEALHAVTDVADYGEHKLLIEAVDSAQKVVSQRMASFYVADRLMLSVPDRFKRWRFHAPANKAQEVRCSNMSCHGLIENAKAGEPGDGCIGCHLIEADFRHGPVSRGKCMQCHVRESGGDMRLTEAPPQLCLNCHTEIGSTPKAHLNKPEASADCENCHTEAAASIKNDIRVHGPSQTGDCTLCHDPHASGHEMYTRRGRVGTCVYCHEGYDKQPHVVASFVGENRRGHPVSNEKSKKYPVEDMTCGSCHNPHFSTHEYQFAHLAQSRQELCKVCHDEKF